MCILELGKVLMYEFHYNYIKNKCGNNSRLIFADTDSWMYEIETENVYEDFSKDQEMCDFSNYWAKLKYYGNSNKSVVGKMTDEETAGVAIEEYVEFVECIHIWQTILVSIRRQKVWIEMLQQQYVITNINMFCWITNVWDIQWIGFKVKIIK